MANLEDSNSVTRIPVPLYGKCTGAASQFIFPIMPAWDRSGRQAAERRRFEATSRWLGNRAAPIPALPEKSPLRGFEIRVFLFDNNKAVTAARRRANFDNFEVHSAKEGTG
jgi:hypothetical protein